jgi:hypothetical protein
VVIKVGTAWHGYEILAPLALWFHGGAPDGSRRPGHGVSRADAIAEFLAAGFVVREEVPKWSSPLWLVVFGK